MGIKFDNGKGWIAHFSKRHPLTGQPKSLRRIHLKSEAEAKRVERELIAQIERSFHESVVPTWQDLVNEFMEFKRNNDWSEKTFQSCKLCLESHTFEVWATRTIDAITTQDIRELVMVKLKIVPPAIKRRY